MNALRHFVLNKRLLIQLVLSYVIVALVIISILTLFITSKVSDNVKQEITSSTDRSLMQAYNTASILLNSTFQQFATAFSSADIQAGFYVNEYDAELMGRISGTLTNLTHINPMIHSAYLVNSRHRIVFSSLTTMRPYEQFYDQQLLQLLEQSDQLVGSIFIPRQTTFISDTKKFDGNLITVAFMNSIDRAASSGALILNLDQKILQEMIMNGSTENNDSFQSMILNRQGVVISHSNPEQINSKYSSQHIQDIIHAESSEGTIETMINNERHRLFYIKADSLGWIFIGDVNYITLLTKVNEIKSYILLATLIILVIVIAIAIMFTRIIYGPIHKLLQNIRTALPQQNVHYASSETDILSSTFDKLNQRINHLQYEMSSYRHIERNNILKQWITGNWSSDQEILSKLAQISIDTLDSQYQICMLKLDTFPQLHGIYSGKDITLLKYAICNIAEEIANRYYKCYCLDEEEDQVIMIILKTSSEEQMILELLEEIQHNIKQYLNIPISAAIGTQVQSLEDVSLSKQHAYEASRYRVFTGVQSIIPYSITEHRKVINEQSVQAFEKQLTESMKLGDCNKFEQGVAQFIDVVQEATIDDALLHFNQMLFLLHRTAKNMASGEQITEQLDISSLVQQLYSAVSLEQIKQLFISLGEEAIQARETQASQKNMLIIEKIKQYIEEHYSDPNLSVDTLAGIAGLSINYMRKIFKDITMVSLNQYITGLRFEKAKQLLLTTDLPANKIGEMVGMDNTKYFYISFKKYCGKTPDHYRKSS